MVFSLTALEETDGWFVGLVFKILMRKETKITVRSQTVEENLVAGFGLLTLGICRGERKCG